MCSSRLHNDRGDVHSKMKTVRIILGHLGLRIRLGYSRLRLTGNRSAKI
jgi:hypothetical protein